jgi:hypothetical protein
MTPAMLALVDALALQAVDDYLTSNTAPDMGADGSRPDPVPLASIDEAA